MGAMGYRSRAFIVIQAVRSHGGRISLMDRLRATPAMIVDVMLGRWKGVGRGRIALSLLALLYVISPVDLIPEVLLGPFGLADDVSLAVLAVASLFNAAEQWVSDQVAADPGPARGRPKASAPQGDVIQGVVLDRK